MNFKKTAIVDEIQRLKKIVARLRGPDGCPWDQKQTHQSLAECLIEECAELLDSIDHSDVENMCEELGDVLLQVVMHAQLAEESNGFDLHTVAYSTAFVTIGINAISFSIISRLFIFQSGLLPNPPLWLHRLQNLKMEWVLLVGICIFFVGLCGAFGSLYLWKLEGFNRLDNPQLTLRIVMLSCLGMVLGIQTIMSAFLLSAINTLRK